MSEPDIDFENPNAIGGLDRLVTNVALSAIAVFPTLGALLVTPWRVAPLIDKDIAVGRSGLLLSPGAFFPLSLIVALLAAAVVTTPETLESNGAFLGPGLAMAVTDAAANGEIWRIIAIVLPIFGFAIGFGVAGRLLTPLAGPGWTLRTSLRAAFYATAAVIAWIIISSAAIDLFRVKTGEVQLSFLLYSLNSIPIFGLAVWIYFWFFRARPGNSMIKSGLLSVLMFVMIAILGAMINWVVMAV